MSTDRDLVIDTTTRLLWYADNRRWNDLLPLFADEVLLDYTSLAGGQPAQLTGKEIVTSWQATLGRLDATQHLVSNHIVDVQGTRATATAQFVATHVLANADGDPVWVLGGHYRWTLVRPGADWVIESMTMTATWDTGNQQIMVPPTHD